MLRRETLYINLEALGCDLFVVSRLVLFVGSRQGGHPSRPAPSIRALWFDILMLRAPRRARLLDGVRHDRVRDERKCSEGALA